jgi:hypothetical protein
VPRVLIEVTHEAEPIACPRAVDVLLRSGSHFITHADFGCMDDDHRAWVLVETETKEEARNIASPAYRPQTRVVALTKFTPEEIAELRRRHGAG